VSQHKNVTLVEVNVEAPGAESEYMKLEQQGQGIPQVVVLAPDGHVATQWLGFVDQAGVDETISKAMSK
jgi:hypothetical protein